MFILYFNLHECLMNNPLLGKVRCGKRIVFICLVDGLLSLLRLKSRAGSEGFVYRAARVCIADR